jgi:hypothetical protein
VGYFLLIVFKFDLKLSFVDLVLLVVIIINIDGLLDWVGIAE